MKNLMFLSLMTMMLLASCVTSKKDFGSSTREKVDYVVKADDDYINEGVAIVRAHKDGRKEIIIVELSRSECDLKNILRQTAPCGSSNIPMGSINISEWEFPPLERQGFFGEENAMTRVRN